MESPGHVCQELLRDVDELKQRPTETRSEMHQSVS